MRINLDLIERFRRYLIDAEKSRSTVEKYIRDVRAFFDSVKGGAKGDGIDVDKSSVMDYKETIRQKYKPKSVNSMLSSLNGFFSYSGHPELKVKTLKIQREVFSSKELTYAEYLRLLNAAGKATRLYFIMMTICATGIRVSELKYITTEAVERGYMDVSGKGKTRQVMIPKELRRQLKKYIRKNGIEGGSVFVTRSGEPVDRGNIWLSMKRLCAGARVDSSKVFPHNLRHLFAVTFYKASKDIVKLADMLGHSSIETTRIYTVESGRHHRMILDKMKLVIKDADTLCT